MRINPRSPGLVCCAEPGCHSGTSTETYTFEDLTLPIPIKVVAPRIRSGQVGQEIKMLFTVTEKGQAIHIRSSKPFSDSPTLVGAMSQVLQVWKFEPALDARGKAVTVKVRMPVKVIKRAEESLAVVSLKLDTPTADKS